MLADFAAVYPRVQKTFALASAVLGYDLWKLTQTGPEAELNLTDKTQPAMLAAGVALWNIWQERSGLQPALMAGHSLGEYTALVCAGALEYADAVALVAARGRYMQEAVPSGEGAMAAILGLDDDRVIEVCRTAAENEIVAAVNFNSPGQVVVAGMASAVARAMAIARAQGAKLAQLLPVSVPSHCILMRPAAERLAQHLQGIVINTPRIPIINNTDAAVYTDPESIRAGLVRQIHSPVRWADIIRKMASEGIKTLIECGPGKVLAGLVKRTEPDITAFNMSDLSQFENCLKHVATETVTT
jgi:[acyl-carrier-protein] S-malonyltransferase